MCHVLHEFDVVLVTSPLCPYFIATPNIGKHHRTNILGALDLSFGGTQNNHICWIMCLAEGLKKIM